MLPCSADFMPTKSRKFAYSYRSKLYSDDVPVAIEREFKYSMSVLSRLLLLTQSMHQLVVCVIDFLNPIGIQEIDGSFCN